MNHSIKKYLDTIKENGWCKVENVYKTKLIDEVKDEFYKYKYEFESIQKKKGIHASTQNATHHTIILCRKMLKLIEYNKVSPILEAYFNGKYILNTMGLSAVPNDGSNVYTQNIHRDVRTFTGASKLWLNTLIMLDDSTEDNGATWMLESSQNESKKPLESYFYKNAKRALGKKGDVILFDGNIWHSAGINTTSEIRHIITPIYSKPFIKQQLDYPYAFGKDYGKICSDHLKQILGYNSLVPLTLNDFYQKEEDRYYKSDQG